MNVKYFLLLILVFCLKTESKAQVQNREPLRANPYVELPLGAIQARGWLKEQLLRMKTGLTGHLDEQYPQVAGKRNGWLGGDGDAWERGPYWIDGLLPLAYMLKDQELIQKVKPWIEWTLTNQREDGYIGPKPLKEKSKPEPGIQKEPVEDWWPRMVMAGPLPHPFSKAVDEETPIVLVPYGCSTLRISQFPIVN